MLLYFHQDDFVNMAHSQTVEQVINSFNIFSKADYPFYRPLSTQLYFYLGKIFFGLNPVWYHLLNFVILGFLAILVFWIILEITKNKQASLTGAFIYVFNTTHIASILSPAYVQEPLLALFGVFSCYWFFRYLNIKKWRYFFYSTVFFILALMSKETAVVIPGLLFFEYVFFAKKKTIRELFFYFLPYTLILGIYLTGHFFYYGMPISDSYKFVLGKQNLNILVWYFLWSVSVPNILIDFIGPGLKINPVFFKVSGINSPILIVSFVVFIFGILTLFYMNITKTGNSYLKLILFGVGWFVIGLIPMLVFPAHHLAIEQSLSLLGISLIIGLLISYGSKGTKFGKIAGIITIVSYIVLAANSYILADRTHWISIGTRQAKSVVEYFKNNYSEMPDGSVIYFRDGEILISEYGSSKQISLALGGDRGLKIMLNKPNLKIYYQGVNPLPSNLIGNKDIIELDASKFLGY